ncbi:MAG: ABC transporter permease [Clostridia bacterium]|nr:ABC transporter permease [Clostridia bacterium]
MTDKTNFNGKLKRSFTFNRGQLCIPYAVFLLLFVIFPLLVIVYYAFTSKSGSFGFDNFVWFFTDETNFAIILRSILIGLVSTVGCLFIGYPVAYVLSRIKSHRRTILLLLFVAPMVINFVLRAMAMKELLSFFGLLGRRHFLNTVIGMVYDYLPFMILPLYSVLIKTDKSLEEAAFDLGAGSVKVFTRITLPLSIPGIISGITMVFLPSMTSYVISDTYTAKNITIIGSRIDDLFGQNDFNSASVIALVLLLIMFVTTAVTGGFSKDENARGVEL